MSSEGLIWGTVSLPLLVQVVLLILSEGPMTRGSNLVGGAFPSIEIYCYGNLYEHSLQPFI